MAETPPGTPRVARHAPDTGLTETEGAHVHGHEMVDKWLNFAGFSSGITLAFLVYMNGLGFANAMLKVPPVRWIRTWLYHRMYFDELYHSVFVEPLVTFSRFCAWFDRFIIDGIVNGAAAMVGRLSRLSGWIDQNVVDGAVNGLGALTFDLGSMVRAPQTGRIRVYVTVLMCAVAVGLAGAIIVALSH
jgi:NADH:ubiquinone oxidoreductase subunit 5 (subunit L)/multisubunit Na+/H+ antiporter MnhA subunit